MIPYLLTQVSILILPMGGIIEPLHTKCTGLEGEYAGVYEKEKKLITMCAGVDGKDSVASKMVLNHELGHHVHFDLITEQEWKEYETEWKKSVELGSGTFLRSYGMTNSMEGFADDFMYLQEGRYFLNRYSKDPVVLQTIKRVDVVRKIAKKIEYQARKTKK